MRRLYSHEDSSVDETERVRFSPTNDGGHVDTARAAVKDGGTSSYSYGTTDVVNQQWHHLAMVRTGGGASSKVKVYVNGAQENTGLGEDDDDTGGGVIALSPSDNGPFIGDQPGENNELYGYLDELRVSSTARSADWIEASWRSQNGTFAFCNFGSLECSAASGQFSYRRALVIDYTKVGNNNSGTLPATGFPVLVSLSGNWLKTTAVDAVNGRIENANGWDIVFRGSNGMTGLYHEIEEYDGTAGTLVAWVRIDSLSKAADTTFYMYYGNDCVNVDPSDPDNVWDASYEGVWHLSEATAATNVDSTSNSNDGSPSGPPSATSSGKIVGALDFDGSDDYVSVGNAGSGIKTVSFWLEADDITSREIIDMDGSDQVEINGSSNIVANSFPGTTTIYVDGSTASAAVTTAWRHVAVTDSTGVNASDLIFGGVMLLYDDFNRADSNTLGNGWTETDSGAGAEASIDNNELDFAADDNDYQPIVSNTFTKQTSGKITWSFIQEFERTGAEGAYEVWLQLGDSATMVSPATSITTGVAVNLRWGDDTNGFTDEEGFGYYDGSSATQIAVVSGYDGYNTGGFAYVTVTADLDANTFDLSVTGDGLISGTGSATGVAFDNNVDIDTVRICFHEIGNTNMGTMDMDHMVIIGSDYLDGKLDEVRISSTARDSDWIKTSYNNQDDATPGAGKFIKSLGTEATAFATAIDLLALSATGGDDAVQVNWETGSETGNLGFYLYRAASPVGPFVRITDQLIAGLNHSVEGRTYSYADTDVTTGQPYYYRLEDLDVDGQRTFHGPVGVDWDGTGAPLVAPGDPDPAPWEPGGESGPVTVSAADEPVYKIMVTEAGLHRLTRDFLAGQGVALDKVDLSRVRLYHQAREVAVWVHDDNSDTVLDAADHITFYALPVAAEYAKYSADNVYWLTTGEGANPVKRMAEVDSAPDDSVLATGFDATVRREQDQYYYPNAPGADELDRWLNETWVVGADISWPGAGDPITFTLDTPGATGAGTLTVALLGTYATDHEVDISVNGGPVRTFSWSGIAFYEAVIEDAALVDGVNTISLTCQTGLDALLLDWLAAGYPRNFAADSDRLQFTSSNSERIQVTGFAGSQLLAFDITDPENVSRSVNFSTSGSGPYSLEFTPPNGAAEARTYRVLSTDALLTPQAVTADAASNLTDAANGADYILITHRNLGWDGSGDPYAWLTDLLAHRQDQGHRVMAVDLTDIYDEFAFGLATPAAIKDFLAYAVSFWTAPAPQYVLLVGDATYDYKDNWGYGAADDVPAYTIFSEEAGETVTDEWYVLTGGGDAVPDLYIGRLPAATAAEAVVMAAKIISYESAVNTKTWQKNVVLAADNRTRDEEAAFESMNEDAADLLPAALLPFRAYLDDYGTAAALNADLMAQIDAGSLLVNYSGHASVQIWAQENIFDSSDVAGLANAGRYPVIISMSCLSGYFAYPAAWNFPSLSEVLLRAADKGAVGMLVPTGQTHPKHQAILNEALFEAIFQDDVRQIGAAIGRAKQILLQDNPQQTDVSQTFLLFGDPAMVLQVPLPRRPTGLTAELTAGSTVALEWSSALDANGGAAAGYHIYRGTGAGGPWTRLNGAALVDTVYSDSDLTVGAAYYYIVTALDTDGDESVTSDTASVVLTDSDGDGLYNLLEAAGCTDANQSDSDSDGLSDGTEDANRNGTVDAGETDPCEADSDADTLPDGWETANGFNALSGSGADGPAADPDGDGWTNYQEYLSCTDPADAAAVPTAPSVPAVNYPADGAEADMLEPWLSVSNAADADCQAVRYIFELYADAGLTTLVEATADTGMAEGDNTTAWQPGSALDENTHYYWRARAYDGLAYSDWLATAGFFVNATAEAPSTAAVSAPPDGSEVTLRRPLLEVANAADADGDPLTYEFRVYADESLTTLVDSQTAVAQGAGGATTWQVATELDDNTDYWWTVQATDDEDLTGDWSAAARFFINTANDAPSTPPGGSPAMGAELTTTTPLLAVVHATDADLDALSYFFEIDTAATFDGFELEQSAELTEEVGVSTSWATQELTDNTTYYWRVRAFDGLAYGQWHSGWVFVNTANEAPAAPTVDHPGDAGEVSTRQPTLTVKAALDVDLDVLVYDFELYEDAEMTGLITAVAGAGLAWQVDQTLDDNRSYFWRARAVDAHGAAGDWSATVSFFVNTANDTPDTPVLNNPVSGGIATAQTPTLSVFNVDDPDQDDLTYTFELYADADLSQLVLAAVKAEGYLITSWTVSAILDDHGIYYWRARADDGQQPGAWMPTAVLKIHTAGTDTAYEIVTRQPVSAAATARQTVSVAAEDTSIDNTVVELPPGALPRDCSIHIGPVTNPPALPRGTRKIGPVIEFGPAGMTFNLPVILKLPYTAADLNQARVVDPVELTVYWYDTSLLAWVPVETLDIDSVNQLISIETDHFSMYTIGADVADASGGGGSGTCFIAAARRAETVFFIGNWSDISICGLLALVGFLWLGRRRRH